jgi:hypothetical protein
MRALDFMPGHAPQKNAVDYPGFPNHAVQHSKGYEGILLLSGTVIPY